jgi:hypothetical protein
VKAEVVGCTFVITPENDKEREDLKYRGSSGLWECLGVSEDDGSLDVQPLCPVGLQDSEIADYVRFLLECDREPLDGDDPNFSANLSTRVREDMDTMDRIRQLLRCE